MFDIFTKPFASWTLIDLGILFVWVVALPIAGIIAIAVNQWMDGLESGEKLIVWVGGIMLVGFLISLFK
jgi:hypothetical protein